ncbi:MAG: T9SS C-terminal target domain-containing protein, partial [Bacteroidetes bacterium]|nr:T9SS C-terminal target domain-containing protein [Bacteroidota bacterium]
SRMNPALNTAYYSLAPAMKIWTSTTLPNKTVSAWYLDTRYGITTYDVKTRKNMVLLVRGGSGNVTAGLKSTADKSMVAYPVPFSDVVKLDGISETTYCKVYNVKGKLLQSGALKAISWPELPSGVYLLQVDGRPGALQIVKSAK